MFLQLIPPKRIDLIKVLNQFDGKVLNFHFSDNLAVRDGK